MEDIPRSDCQGTTVGQLCHENTTEYLESQEELIIDGARSSGISNTQPVSDSLCGATNGNTTIPSTFRFLDLPGEICSLVYEEAAKSKELNLFSTSKQVRQEGVSISSKYFVFTDLLSMLRHPYSRVRATTFVQHVWFQFGLDIWGPDHQIRYLHGSAIARESCRIVLDFIRPISRKGKLHRYPIVQAIKGLTGFRTLSLRFNVKELDFTTPYRSLCNTMQGLYDELQDILAPSLGAGKLCHQGDSIETEIDFWLVGFTTKGFRSRMRSQIEKVPNHLEYSPYEFSTGARSDV